MRKLPDSQRRILDEMVKGSVLARVQAFPWAPVKHMLGDKVVPAGPVAALAMGGFIRPNVAVTIGADRITFELTEKGARRQREAA